MQTFFTALADRTRRRILNLLREQEICVCFLTEVLEVSQPKISRHLAYLRNAEIVSARREGKWMYYRIVEPEDLFAGQILRDTLEWLKSEDRMQADYQKLMLICNLPDVSVTITRARKSDILPQADMLDISSRTKDMETYLL